MNFARLLNSCLWASLAVLLAYPAAAQQSIAPLLDARILPAGVFRFGIQSHWIAADERFGSPRSGGGNRQDFGSIISSSSLGSADAPSLAPFEQRIREMTGLGGFQMSLGRAQTRAQYRQTAVPVVLEYGITRRITVGITVPIVRTVINVSPTGNVDSAGVNAGISPSSYDASESSRLQQLASQFTSALSQLRSRYPTCFTSPPASGCSPVIALDSSARAYSALVAGTYGAPAIVPAAGTPAQDSVTARLNAFNEQFRSALGLSASANPIAIRPRGALPIGVADLQRIVTDSIFGIAADSLNQVELMTLGDVEAGLTISLLDRWSAPGTRRMRATASAIYRAGTGRAPRPNILLDAATGDGQNDLEGRLAADMMIGSRFMGSVLARYTLQMADQVDMRLPSAGIRLVPFSARDTLDRNLGDQSALDVRGHFSVSRYLGFFAGYGFWRHGNDTYSSGAAEFSSPARGAQSFSIGMTYSTFDAFLRGRAWAPMEIGFIHRQVFSGTGGVPRYFTDAVELRIYAGGNRRSLSR